MYANNPPDVDNNSLYTQPEDIHQIYKALSPVSYVYQHTRISETHPSLFPDPFSFCEKKFRMLTSSSKFRPFFSIAAGCEYPSTLFFDVSANFLCQSETFT
jgi:hypothetical protein